MSLYVDCPEIVECLNAVDYSVINRKFLVALFERIDPNEFEMIDEFLHSDPYYNYLEAIQGASMTVTTELAQLIELATMETKGRLN